MEKLLNIPVNVNKKSKEIFEKCFQVKLNPDDKLDYYLWHNNELSVILQRTNVTITFVFQENGKIRFTIKKRNNKKSLLQGEFSPLEINNPEIYIEKLIRFFE
jgi:hypothetical protein